MTIRELEVAFAAYTGEFADRLRDLFRDWRAMRNLLEETRKLHDTIDDMDADQVLTSLRIEGDD